MTYRLDLFNSFGDRVAILQDEILISAELNLEKYGAPTVEITIPYNCDKAQYINPQYYLKIWNTKTAQYEYSIFELTYPNVVDSDSELLIKANYVGILSRLSREHVDSYDTGSAGDTFENVITDLLALQVNSPAITVGTLEITDTIAISAESSDIYSILNSIQKSYGGWFEVDSLYQLNWYEDNTGDPVREIRRSKNLKAIEYTPKYQDIVNRVYAYGKGEGEARLSLKDYTIVSFNSGANEPTDNQACVASIGILCGAGTIVSHTILSGSYAGGDAAGIYVLQDFTTVNITVGYQLLDHCTSPTVDYGIITEIIYKSDGTDYVEDTTSQATYGVRARKFIDKTITHPVTLVSWAERLLDLYKDPTYQYSVDIANLAEIKGFDYSFESLGLDTRVRVIDDLLNVDVNTSIVSMSINLLAPEDIEIELSTVTPDISDIFKDLQINQDITNSVATQIGAGQVTVLGTFVVQDWVTGGTTTIDGGNITANTITTSQLNFTPVEDTNVVASINASSEGITINADKISIEAQGQNIFNQATEPASGMREYDLWLDSDDGYKMYQYLSSTWTAVPDADIAQALSDALGAQTTADLKVNTFYQTGIPTSLAVGDLWFDTDDNNKCYRAQSIGADEITAGEWVDAELANTGNIVATINLSSEGVQISGNLIEITGSTTFASGYDPTSKVASLAGIYNSAASGARVRIFPDTDTGIQVVDASSNDVFKCLVGGTDSGDVIVGNYSGGAGAKWDNSASTFDIQGTLTACTVGTGQTITVNGTMSCGNIDIKGVGFNYILIDGTYYTRLEDGTLNIGTALGAYNFTASTDGIQCIQTSSSAYFTTLNSSRYVSYNNATINLLNNTTFSGNIVTSDDIECDDISCNDITLDSSGQINFTDTSHRLYRDGNDLYYYDGTTATKLN